MKLSVIIVNYNVRAYLEQCLRTVVEALKNVDGDIFVVDNQSTDGSVEMVHAKFPQVKLIINQENVGFSRANNQAIRSSDADYVVLLNPDTVVGEDVFKKVLRFLDDHPKAGGLGVKMVDGKGVFLPESKRGLPTPAVAFYKIIGLTRLFPHSRTFGRYHLGHLPEHEAAPIEILSGACMFLRKKTLDEVGLLDESFFMYGEDIDLSYRITLGGYENWYLPAAQIIHYKGESTKKSSVNYVFVFYNAMAIFAKKHFTRRPTDFFSLLINGSIYLSAAGAIVARFLRRALLPMLDVITSIAFLWILDALFKGIEVPRTGPEIRLLSISAVLLVLNYGAMGAYDLPIRLLNVVKGAVTFALVWSLITYGSATQAHVLVIFLGALVFGIAVGATSRSLLHLGRIKPFSLRSLDRKRVLAIGSEEENTHALALLWQTHFGLGRQRTMLASEATKPDAISSIRKKIRKHGIDEIVFCAKDLQWGRIIELMEGLRRTDVMFKIAQPAREFIIGPNSIESLNDLFIMERHAVHSASGRRAKRMLDVSVSVLFSLLLPISAMLFKKPKQFVRNWWDVFCGRKSWVGYGPIMEQYLKLPAIKPGILDPLAGSGPVDPVSIARVNIAYAKDYKAWNDLRAVIKGFSLLGGR